MKISRTAVLVAFGLMLGAGPRPDAAPNARETVRFRSATQPLGNLQQRLAQERGDQITGIEGDLIQGYLATPSGTGPFPAIVVLHGCSGLRLDARQQLDAQLAAWGFAVLEVDSFTTRHVEQMCLLDPASIEHAGMRTLDAYGALIYLASLSFIDEARVSLLGFSHGASVVLKVAEKRSFDLFENPRRLEFKAAVAYYPMCKFATGPMNIPLLILVGEKDDWTPALDCQRFADDRARSGELVELKTYPGAYHAFDVPELVPARRSYGHLLEFNPGAASSALQDLHAFLNKRLVGP